MVLRQSRFRAEAGGGPLHAMVPWDDGLNSREAFLNAGHSPPFEGPGAGFRLIRHEKGAYSFIERVADKGGAGRGGVGGGGVTGADGRCGIRSPMVGIGCRSPASCRSRSRGPAFVLRCRGTTCRRMGYPGRVPSGCGRMGPSEDAARHDGELKSHRGGATGSRPESASEVQRRPRHNALRGGDRGKARSCSPPRRGRPHATE